jgi:hypothetical protein
VIIPAWQNRQPLVQPAKHTPWIRSAVGVPRGVQARDVDALDPGEGDVQRVAVAPRGVVHEPRRDRLVQLADDLLAVPEDAGVEERRERLGVVGAVPAREHDRVGGSALFGVQGDASEVEHVEDVGVGELG